MQRMLTRALVATGLAVGLLLSTSNSVVQGGVNDGELRDAISAALAQLMVDPRFKDFLLNDFGIPAAKISDPALCAEYPSVTQGSLLDRILEKRVIRVGFSADPIPFSFIRAGDRLPDGIAIRMWPLIVEKLSRHYGRKIDFRLVQSHIPLNEMFTRLATADDPNCEARDREAGKESRSDSCWDINGGGFAIDATRLTQNDFTCSYVPAILTAVRTPRDFTGSSNPLKTARQVFEAICDPALHPVIAAIPGSLESRFLETARRDGRFCFDRTGVNNSPTFSQIDRDGTLNVLEFAETTQAHLVLGTDARLLFTFRSSPDACKTCQIIEGVLSQLGGFAFGVHKTKSD
ncbi:MAG: hypothetical protein HY315_06045 [Acidobacteria bacterium]|nr:hypothetical protein [Acidobacteriota bacterium]